MTKNIPLDSIRIDGGTQPRAEIDLFAVTDYAEALERGDDFPPGNAVFDGKEYWLWDGFHRFHGHRKAGRESMPLVVTKGTIEDARWLALGANKTHGLRRKPEDVTEAVRKALELKPDVSDQTIADHVGVSQPTVWRRRKELEATHSVNKSPEVRTGRDGRTINTANIGKRPAEPELTPIEQYEQEQAECDNTDDDPPDNITVDVLHQLAQEAADNRDYETALEYANEAVEVAEHLEEAAEISGRVGLTLTDNQPTTTYVTLDAWNKMTAKAQRQLVADAAGQAKFNDQGNNENIEWALWSWNPVTGCLHNCPYCYARDIANRFYEQKFQPSLIPSRLKAPHNTTFPAAKAAEWMGHKNVFTCSMADLFGRWVPKEWIDAVLTEVCAAPQWNFLFLTKFPIRMAEFDFPENAWVGTTVDCQARVANAEKAFRKVKARVKWLSVEPMIEPLKFTNLGAFQWLVIGGSSPSSQTPEWHPPRRWVNDLQSEAAKCKVSVYEKTNLLARLRGYPESPAVEPVEAPESLRYLPMDSR